MRAFVLASSILLSPFAARAAAPKAVLTGPDSVAVGQLALLQFAGANPDGTPSSTVSDVDPVLVEALGPSVSPLYFYDKAGKPAAAIVSPKVAGTYLFVLAAVGTPPGASSVSYDFATLVVQVGQSPKPPDPPQPQPTDPIEKVGAAYAPVMASSHADAWNAYADVLAAGGKMADASKAYTAKYVALETAWNAANIAPIFKAIIAEGAEPDATQRAALIDMGRKMANGLKSRVTSASSVNQSFKPRRLPLQLTSGH